ncbi:rRNA-processing protein CGR1 [Tremella mesenterica]|uniref:rRNA-processing protein n=1 Tax=Tremella mesenterica TaxID=5217 RepID=A0A4Q1BF00_TREME|nr:rRNA-processing protein CGR1 [Tremella mesenterica]
MQVEQLRTSETGSLEPKPLARSKLGKTNGKGWKAPKETAVRRSYISPSIKTSFAKRKELEKTRQAVRDIEREMKEEKATEDERKRTAIRERRERQAEKERQEQLKAKMSAKKLQRMKKRLGRTKKVNG